MSGLVTLGVALAIPEPFAAELGAYRERFRDPMAHAIPAHITIVPPVQLPRLMLGEVGEHLERVAAGSVPFEVRLRGTGTFRPVSPVVFVPLVTGISGCEALERATRVAPLDVPVHFPYHPHVTVAHHVTDDILDEAFEAMAGYDASFTVSALNLYEHGGDGIWRPIRAFAFGG